MYLHKLLQYLKVIKTCLQHFLFKDILAPLMTYRRSVKIGLPPHVLHRFPPDHPLRQSHTCHSSNSSSEEDETLVIPQTADVYSDVVDGTPGLQIETRNTSSWTPIACRTRSKSILARSVK